MKKLFFFSIILISLFSCKQEEVFEVPDDMLTREQLAPILVDMHIADATLISQQLDNKETRFKGENYYEMVFVKHNITREQFDAAIAFYARFPKQYEEIYNDVLDTLSYRQGEVTKQDSLRFAEIEEME